MTLSRDDGIALLGSGLCVLPAIPGEKRPDLAGWKAFQKALPSRQQIETWFENAQGACLVCGAVSGNLEMIDFDLAGELFPAWRDIVDAQAPGLLARLVIERTPGGGKHVVYRCECPVPGNDKLAQRAVMTPDAHEIVICSKSYKPRKKGDGYEVLVTLVETRGEGGLFLCDPTPGYALEQGKFTGLPDITAAEREILITAARSLNEVIAAPKAEAVCSGAGRPGDDYNERGDVRAVLQKHGWTLARPGENEHWCRPGKDHGTSATLKGRVFFSSTNAAPFVGGKAYSPFSVYAHLEHNGDFKRAATALRAEGFGVADPGDVNLSGFMAAEPTEPPEPREPSGVIDPGPLPHELLRVPGFVSEVMDHCLATAPYPNTVMAFCGALALQAFLAGRKVRDPGNVRPNLYLLGLAHSAAGKDWPRKLNTRILYKLGLAHHLGDRFASGEGLQDALFITPAMLYQTDEIDGMLQMIRESKDARYENIMGTLLSLYTSSDSVFPMRRKAGQEAATAIDQPCLVVFGTAIPQNYYQALSAKMLTNGFFARMLVLESAKRGKGKDALTDEPPARVLETAAWWRDYQPTPGNLTLQHPEPARVPQADEAKAILAAGRVEAEQEYSKAEDRGDGTGTTVWGRFTEQTLKLALLYAVSESHTNPMIGKDAAEWAVRFMRHQTHRMLFMAGEHTSENPFHARCQALVQRLRNAPGRRLPHSVLLKRMKLKAKEVHEIIETLTLQGDITIHSTPRNGSPRVEYELSQGA